MPNQQMAGKIEDMRERLSHDHGDPRELHDAVTQLVADLDASHSDVPPDLREAAEELEAEILEEFYDNLPV